MSSQWSRYLFWKVFQILRNVSNYEFWSRFYGFLRGAPVVPGVPFWLNEICQVSPGVPVSSVVLQCHSIPLCIDSTKTWNWQLSKLWDMWFIRVQLSLLHVIKHIITPGPVLYSLQRNWQHFCLSCQLSLFYFLFNSRLLSDRPLCWVRATDRNHYKIQGV